MEQLQTTTNGTTDPGRLPTPPFSTHQKRARIISCSRLCLSNVPAAQSASESETPITCAPENLLPAPILNCTWLREVLALDTSLPKAPAVGWPNAHPVPLRANPAAGTRGLTVPVGRGLDAPAQLPAVVQLAAAVGAVGAHAGIFHHSC